MTDWIMTVVDTVGIQPYIFGSNNLKHIVGASHLVHEATHNWVYGCLVDVGKTNVDRRGKISDQQHIAESTHGLTSELVYAGGGNAVVLFKDPDDARQFTRRLTENALLEAPGLQLVVVHQPFAWGVNLADVRRAAFKLLDAKKRNRQLSSPLLGLSVTADCQFTGLPAVTVDRDEDNRRISAEVVAKLKAFERAQQRLRELSDPEYSFVLDFDDFGDKGESSYIAVVHTDGNGMGDRIAALEVSIPAANPRAYIDAMRKFSDSIQKTAEGAMDATIEHLIWNIDKENKKKLPFRPIVFGGDDITFVCDGRRGLTLAEFYLRRLTGRELSHGGPLTARAGIAVVNSHYPFARAYGLAEELAGSAKQHIRDAKRDMTVMDWHFAVSGLVLELAAIREREYTGKAGDLVMRPIALDDSSSWRNWTVFTGVMNGFRGKEWIGRRNKLKALREALRSGKEGVREFTQAVGALPEIDGQPEARREGWIGKRCAYYDAVEALDFYVPLDSTRPGGGA